MALADEIKLRYSERFIRQITNPDKSGLLVIDDARLTRASDEAESIFKQIFAFFGRSRPTEYVTPRKDKYYYE